MNSTVPIELSESELTIVRHALENRLDDLWDHGLEGASSDTYKSIEAVWLKVIEGLKELDRGTDYSDFPDGTCD